MCDWSAGNDADRPLLPMLLRPLYLSDGNGERNDDEEIDVELGPENAPEDVVEAAPIQEPAPAPEPDEGAWDVADLEIVEPGEEEPAPVPRRSAWDDGRNAGHDAGGDTAAELTDGDGAGCAPSAVESHV